MYVKPWELRTGQVGTRPDSLGLSRFTNGWELSREIPSCLTLYLYRVEELSLKYFNYLNRNNLIFRHQAGSHVL